VHAVWDLGWNDAMCIVMCQRVASSVSVIDYLETSHRTYAEIVAQLNAKPYRWGTDFLPHDGKAKNPQTGKSAIETVSALGRTVDEVPNIGIEEGIRAARQLFAQVAPCRHVPFVLQVPFVCAHFHAPDRASGPVRKIERRQTLCSECIVPK
jgi:hypothetical protein